MPADAPQDDDHTTLRPAPGRVTDSDGDRTAMGASAATVVQDSAVGVSLPVGTVLQDFEIVSVLGEGGFGVVYLAMDHSLGRRVALKEFMPSALASRTSRGQVQVKSDKLRETFDVALRSFINEARLLAAFDHPSLIKVYRFWEANGTAYMAMPYVEGRTLKDALREMDGPPDEAWLRQLLLPLTDALQVIHAEATFHRDIAPDNVMLLAGSGRPLLLDFGAARRVIGDATQALTVILKAGYAPVEQYGETPGMKQGPWTDVYALGALLHFAIMGRTPPPSVGRLLNDSYVPLVQAAAGRYSRAFLAAIDRALAVRPEARTPSVELLRLELGLSGSEAGAVTPELRAADGDALADVPHNLPAQATRFLGREQEVRDVKALLAGSRLVTLLGMGGLGKTRLSLQVGEEMLPAFPDGVWFLDLAALRDPGVVISQAAQLFGLREEPGRDLLDTLVVHLASRKALLIMDNCEHLMQVSGMLVRALMAGTQDVRILTSSREALRDAEERVFAVQPLALPQTGDDVATLMKSSAVRLFVERAKDHKRGFTLTERDAPAVAELVARLEGIPLALELAAARLRAMSVADINTRLKDRYKLLSRGSESAYERQHTLRALVDWSYEMLDDGEKRLLARLGVFVGGLTMDAAEAICGTDPLQPDDMLDLLSSLVEKSLVMMEERDDGSTRYRMLETLRDYAREKLQASGEFDAVAAAHGQHYFAFAKQMKLGLMGQEQGAWTQRGEADIDNLRAATALALAGGMDRVIAVKLAVALQGFWVLRGRIGEGRAVVRAALALDEVRAFPAAHAHALYVGAALALVQGDQADALPLLTECLALRRAMGNPAEIAATLSTLAKVQLHVERLSVNGAVTPAPVQPERRRWGRGHPEAARASAQEALTLLREVGDPVGESIALQDLGQIALFEGDLATGADWLQQSLTVAQRIQHQEVEAECELLLGQIALAQGDLAQAQGRMARARQISSDAGDSRGLACAQLGLGQLAAHHGELAQARAQLREALATFQAAEMRAEWPQALLAVAAVAAQGGKHAPALRVLAATDAALRRLRVVRSAREVATADALMASLLAQLPAAQAEAARHEGQGWDMAAATQAALVLCA